MRSDDSSINNSVQHMGRSTEDGQKFLCSDDAMPY